MRGRLGLAVFKGVMALCRLIIQALSEGLQLVSKDSVEDGIKKNSGFLTWGYLRDISAIIFLFVCAYRIAVMDVVVDLTGFSFTDVLSMFLAMSAIALSAAFYFKADESSQGFYNNTYHFTKDVSEILGRIESGFGEKLRHIDEGYSGLSQKFDRMPFDKSAAKADEETKEAEIQEQEAQRQNIIEDLMKRAHLAGEEKRELVSRLSQLSSELDRSRAELHAFREGVSNDNQEPYVFDGFRNYIVPFLRRHFTGSYKAAPLPVVANRFKRVLNDAEFDSHDVQYMENNGLLREGRLTDKGSKLIKNLLVQEL